MQLHESQKQSVRSLNNRLHYKDSAVSLSSIAFYKYTKAFLSHLHAIKLCLAPQKFFSPRQSVQFLVYHICHEESECRLIIPKLMMIITRSFSCTISYVLKYTPGLASDKYLIVKSAIAAVSNKVTL